MAKYPAVITTMAGTNATAEANASKQALIFTKIVIGAGDPPASIARATGLTDKRLELAITKSTKSGDGQFTVQASLSNANLVLEVYRITLLSNPKLNLRLKSNSGYHRV